MSVATVPVSARPGSSWAWAAFVLGAAYASVSAAWGLGSTWALDTVGGTLASEGHAGNPLLVAVVWLSVVLKLVAAVLGLVVTRSSRPVPRLVGYAAWTAAAVLTLYGGVLTLAGLLVQVDVIHASADADHRALAWHAYLWDPWFLLWGVLLLTALLRHRRVGLESRTARLQPPGRGRSG